MKYLYLGISSKFIHTMPAGWFLAEFLNRHGIKVKELYHNVNEKYADVLDNVLREEFDTLLISVYIFNVDFIRKLIKDIKLRKPCCTVIAGGPEVSEDFEADHIIIGEGEKALYGFLTKGGRKVIREENIADLDTIPTPYTEERLSKSVYKLIYYESSRGCPFKCSYCMAGLTSGVRYFSIERVKEDLLKIASSGAKVVKFTDRTFNANVKRTDEILQFIRENFSGRDICFHFEVGGDLFRESTMKILEELPVGLVQMEAGVQTLNEESLKAVNRVFDKEKFIDNISRIRAFGNIHIHLDLIAGLPHETRESFIKSFNQVYLLRPHMLQLGFLKFLKGTPIRENFAAEYCDNAPYEVISTPTMSEDDLKELKSMEWAFDRLYNSGRFRHTLDYLLNFNDNPYQMFLEISRHLERGGIMRGCQQLDLIRGILSFHDDEKVKEFLRFDYLLTNRSRSSPACLRNQHTPEFRRFLSIQPNTSTVLFEEFTFLPDRLNKGHYIVKFDYSKRNSVSRAYGCEIMKANYST